MIFNINSTFKPFTFEDFAKPMIMYKQAYEDMEKNIATLTDQTEMWKNIAEQEKSPVAYNLYKSYSDKLNSVAEDFSRGMSMSNRGELLNLRKGYATNIVPIVNAYKRRQTLIDAAQDAALKNPTLEFQYDPRTMSLDDVIADPNKTWGNVINGALLTEQAGKMAANLARAAQSGDKDAQKQLEQILPYQYEYIKKTGFDYSEVVRAITDPEHGAEALTRIIDTVMAGSGINDWTNLKDANGNFTKEGLARYKKIRSYAEQGLYNAIGQEQTQILKDDFGANMAMKQYEAQLAAETAAGDEIPDGTKVDTDDLSFGGSSIQDQAVNDAKTLGFSSNYKNFSHHVKLIITEPSRGSGTKGFVEYFDPNNWEKDKNGRWVLKDGVTINRNEQHGVLTKQNGQPTTYTKSFRLWGETGKYGTTGKMLTKSQFVAQGKTYQQKKALSEYYDKALAARDRWMSGKNANEVSVIAKNLQGLHGNFIVKGIRYQGEDNVEMITPFIRSLRKIQGVDSKGNIKLNRDGQNHGVGMSNDEIRSFNERTHPEKGSPTLTKEQISFHILPGDPSRPNNKGIVVSIPDKKGKSQYYLLPYEAMTGNMRNAYSRYAKYISEAEKEAKQKGYNAEQTKQYVDAVKEQQMSALLKEINFAMQGSYSSPKVKTYDDPK